MFSATGSFINGYLLAVEAAIEDSNIYQLLEPVVVVVVEIETHTNSVVA